MPLFEYRCSACGHLEEVLQKHGEPPPDPCPQCGRSTTMSKEVSLTSFQLKGGGWYKDLYASTPKDGGKKDASSSDGGASTSSSGTSSSGTSSSGTSSSGTSSSGTSSSGTSSSGTSPSASTKSATSTSASAS